VLDDKGSSCVIDPKSCPPGKEWREDPPGCIAACPAGKTLDDKSGGCLDTPRTCAPGKEWKDAFGACVPVCPPDRVLDFYGVACHPIKVERWR
jgi:hypothetical protein